MDSLFAPPSAQPAAPPDLFAPASPVSTPPPQAGTSFDDLFGGPAPAPAPPPPPQSGSSDFAKYFDSPLGASSMPIEAIEQGKMAPPPPPSAKPFRGPGDFTLQFGRDSALPPPAPTPGIAYTPPPPPTPQARMSSGATGLFSAPKPNYGEFDSGPAAPSGPGEFTRIIQGPPKEGGSSSSTPSYAAPPPSAVAAPAPQQKSKMFPILMGILAVVVVGLLITVVILMLRK
jgi:hypothetical protein